MRRPPRLLAHGGDPDVAVGAMEGFNPFLIPVYLIAKVTGGPLEPGTCDRCHYRYKDIKGGGAEVWTNSKMSSLEQVLLKMGGATLGAIAMSLLLGGGIATLLGAVGGNLLARPIVDSLAKSAGPDQEPPVGAEILPSTPPK